MCAFCIFIAWSIALEAVSLQSQHYRTMMPDMFLQLQELDEKRIKNIKNFMVQSAEIEKNVFPIISKCLDGIVRAAEQIDEKEVGNLIYKNHNTVSSFNLDADSPEILIYLLLDMVLYKWFTPVHSKEKPMT
jgi:hypothetical protein